MINKNLAIVIAIVILVNLQLGAVLAAPNCTVNSIPDTMQGSDVVISGTASGLGYYVQLIIRDFKGDVKLYDNVLINEETGTYSKTVKIPYTWDAGSYTVTVGTGTLIIDKSFNVTSMGNFVGINDITVNSPQYDDYVPPDSVVANYENGTATLYGITWTWINELNVNVAGQYKATGSVLDTRGIVRTVNLVLVVNPVAIKSIPTKLEDMDVAIGDNIVLPKFVDAVLANGKVKALPVTWTPDPASISTAAQGTHDFTGTVTGFPGKVRITVNVIDPKGDITPVGLSLWAEADNDSLVIENGKVIKWIDKSGKGNDLTPNEATKGPTVLQNAVNKHKAVNFNGIDNLMKVTLDNTFVGDSTVFIVSKIPVAADYKGLFTTSPGGPQASCIEAYPLNANQVQIRSSSSSGNGTPLVWYGGASLDTSKFHTTGFRVKQTITDGKWKKSTIDGYYDGAVSLAPTDVTDPLYKWNSHYGYLIGSRGTGDNMFLSVQIAEVIVYHRALSDSEISDINKYLNDKYLLKQRYIISENHGSVYEGTIPSSLTISNKSSKTLDSAVAISAAYNTNNALNSTNFVNVSNIAPGADTTVRADLTVGSDQSALSFKAFLWNSLEDMAPLAATGYTDYTVPSRGSHKVKITGIKTNGNEITVDGVTPAGPGKKITVLSALAGSQLTKDKIYYIGEAVSAADGSFEIKIIMPDKDAAGNNINADFDLYVGGEEALRSDKAVYPYTSESIRINALSAVKTADKLQLGSIFDRLSEHRRALASIGLNMAEYDSLNDLGKDYIQNNILAVQNNIDTSNVGASSALLASAFNDNMPVAVVNSAANAGQMLQTLKKYSDLFGIQLGTDAAQDAYIASYTLNKLPINGKDDVKTIVSNGRIIYSINNSSFVSMSNLIIENAEFLGIDKQANYTYYKNLSSANKETINKEIVKSLASVPAKSEGDVAALFNENVTKFQEGKLSSGPARGSGGNGNGSGLGASSFYNLPDIPVQTPVSYLTFTDLDSVEWAKPAINTLAQKKIINGISDKMFAPNNAVKREEYAKMLVLAFGIFDENAECSFSDVSKNEWYYPYIASLEKIGVIKGLDNATFGIGQNITRQDMAVLSKRLIEYLKVQLANVTAKIEFADQANIADYAKDSVSQMQQSGIFTGRENNAFNPTSNATRAEAVTIIYRIMINSKIE